MFTKCPTCGSLNVRRSSMRAPEASGAPRFRSPYRCRDCGARFWVISRRASYLVGLTAIAAVLGAFVWNVGNVPEDPRRASERAAVPVESVADTIKRAERYDPVAEYKLAHLYATGNGVEGNKRDAQKWLELAAANGHPDAQYALGQMYHAGIGVPADSAKAYMWFNLAAARDVPGASVQRDALLRSLTPAQVLEAQAEARRLSREPAKRAASAP